MNAAIISYFSAIFLHFAGLSNLGQAIVISLGTVQASRISHSGLLKSILRAPMSFFDTNPHGRILNRFGTDIDTIDFKLLLTLKVLLQLSTGVFTTIFIIMYSTPVFIIAFIQLAVFYFLVQVRFSMKLYICLQFSLY